MPKYTKPELVESNLRQAYDDAYYSSRRNLIRFTLGEHAASPMGSNAALSGEIPDDIDILPRYYEPGQSRRILTNAALMMAKVCYSEPDPSYPDQGRWKEIVTKAFNKTIFRGRPFLGSESYGDYGEWAPEIHRMFLDGDGLGVGFVQIGVKNGWTTIQHHPLCRTIWDRHRLGLTRSRFICFVHHLPVEEAKSLFGNSIEKEAGPDTFSLTSNNEYIRVIKALQWFDMGLDGSEPTEMWRLRNMQGRVLDIGSNEYECLPFAHYEHMHLFGMRRPVGRGDFQIPDQEMRNGLERYWRLVLQRGPGFDAVDTDGMEEQDLEKLTSGELLTLIKYKLGISGGKVGDRINRVPAHEVPDALFRGLEYLDRMDPGNSGISDADRANITSTARTLGEIENVQQGADSQKQWSLRQFAQFQSRLWYKVNFIAAKLHTAPTPLSIMGKPILFNDPQSPQSSLDFWLTPCTRPVVNEETLERMDPLRRASIALGKWLPIVDSPILGPISNPVEILKEIVGPGFNEKDPDRFINPQALAMAQGQEQMGLTDVMAGGPMTGATTATPGAAPGMGGGPQVGTAPAGLQS